MDTLISKPDILILTETWFIDTDTYINSDIVIYQLI